MTTKDELTQNTDSEIDIYFGHHEIVIKKRYEFFYNLNDIMIAVWFLVGSIFFFWSATKDPGIWLFVLGSAQLLIRPFIRIIRKIHLKQVNPSSSDTSSKTN
ncbi:YrhK family protein [Tuberibacillus sp. Marseille-P3662]|uniref:YrhK family protein n=1 Tax=Tuberibacillus sp. Marseille-P3662 TaxID=1965358 RepID=UPI00111C24B3|nr:YrhK family protein [Tuberibacillus sp. Marseille-P3662]